MSELWDYLPGQILLRSYSKRKRKEGKEDKMVNEKINFLQQGWECPKCGAVMSPSTSVCINCRGVGDSVASSGRGL